MSLFRFPEMPGDGADRQGKGRKGRERKKVHLVFVDGLCIRDLSGYLEAIYNSTLGSFFLALSLNISQ